ncbi:DUF2059 domain-containing protein [Sphingopyxis panaciterrulae]|uniref:DUF2059 domain-containing protein n=1 Tax=Sphingopyxis panaciterrulae TaxID=462372 RepID=A0A7W9B5H1_9SPHN|nr:DUF2059 domain-containing protein [Sphingopyxis panaciterrulae]MBB5706357.1 hypothetical protein [Sphingopyxis panaciterrulae]
MSTWKYMLLTAAFAAPPLHAQEAASAAVAPAEAPASDRIAAAQSLIEVMMPAAQREEMMGQLVAVTMANVSAGMQQHFGAAELAADPKAKTVFDRFVARQQQLTVEQLRTQLPGLFDAMARAYARRFTVAQLGEIETFFRTPTGRIYVTESMNIMSDPDIAAWQRQSIASSMERLPAELERLSQELKDAGVQTDASTQS